MTLSVKQFFERMDTDLLRTDQPCDAGYVWTLMDNVAHMVDVSPKYRINFLHARNQQSNGAFIINQNNVAMEFHFPTDLIDEFTYPCYDVRVAVSKGAAGTMDPEFEPGIPIRASIVLPNVWPPVTGIGPGVIGTLTGETPDAGVSAVTEWSIDGTITTADPANVLVRPTRAPNLAGFEAFPGEQMWLKLLIELDQADLEYNYDEFPSWGYIAGVQVREYPR